MCLLLAAALVARGAMSAPSSIDGVHKPLRTVTCEGKRYDEYTLGDAVAPGKPLLRDLFSGKAKLAPIGDPRTEAVKLSFSTPGVLAVDERVAIFRVPGHDEHYAFVRGIRDQSWKIYLMVSKDRGLSFAELGNVTRFNEDSKIYDNYIDPAITVDHGTCPPTYRMTAECSYVPTGRVDVCVSETKTPLDLKSWSRMKPIVRGDNAVHSGSTGVTLLDPVKNAKGEWETRRYVKWSDVQNRDGLVTTVVHRNDRTEYLGASGSIGTTVLDAERFPCQGQWDCNNRDGQDWKREGDQYFLSYNGGNYFGCDRPRTGKNVWGLSFARAVGSPTAPYERLAEPLLMAVRDDVCGISYPYVNVIDGEIFVYYAYYAVGGAWPGANHTVRSRLVPVSEPGRGD